MTTLAEKKCVPCGAGSKPLSRSSAEKLLAKLSGWSLDALSQTIAKTYSFPNFADAMTFANQLAVVAEQEGHHPDFCISWGRVDVSLSTHAIGGLSENDFILAAKADNLQ